MQKHFFKKKIEESLIKVADRSEKNLACKIIDLYSLELKFTTLDRPIYIKNF